MAHLLFGYQELLNFFSIFIIVIILKFCLVSTQEDKETSLEA